MTGGLQISFWKAVRQLTGPPYYIPRESAITELSKALSDKQWEQLARQHPRNGVPKPWKFEHPSKEAIEAGCDCSECA